MRYARVPTYASDEVPVAASEYWDLLLDWPAANGAQPSPAADSIEVTLQADGLRVSIQKMPQDLLCWVHLARLGECLARRLVGARLS